MPDRGRSGVKRLEKTRVASCSRGDIVHPSVYDHFQRNAHIRLMEVRVPLLCYESLGICGCFDTSISREVPVPGVDFQMVRSLVSMSDVLALVEFVPSESSGTHCRGPCPIHGSRSQASRSFSVDLERNAFRCFQCDVSGNQLDFWAAVTESNLHQAAIDLCERLNLDIPWIRKW